MTDSFDHLSKSRVWLAKKGDWLKCVDPSPSAANCRGHWFRTSAVLMRGGARLFVLESDTCAVRLSMPYLKTSCWEPDESGDLPVGESPARVRAR